MLVDGRDGAVVRLVHAENIPRQGATPLAAPISTTDGPLTREEQPMNIP